MDHLIRERIYEFIDGTLGAADFRGAAEHIGICPECAREIELIRAIETPGRSILSATSPDFTEGVMARIFEEMPRVLPAMAPKRRRFLLPAIAAVAYIGAILLIALGPSGNDGADGGGWLSVALASIGRSIAYAGADMARLLSTGLGGGFMVAITAIISLAALDSLFGRRSPRGRT